MTRLLCLVVLLFAAGCQDVLGLGATCAGEMADVRRAEGGPPDRTNRNRDGDDFLEQWIYDPSGGKPGRVYTFRWGLSFESCEVIGPVPLAAVLGEDGKLPARPPQDR